MGYFDGLAQTAFNKDEEGRHLFFPNGKLGKGYVLKDDSQYEDLLGFTKKRYMIMLGLILVAVIINLPLLWLLLLLAAILSCDYVLVQDKVKNLEPSATAFNIGQARQRSANAFGLPVLIACEIITLLFVAGGIWLLARPGNNDDMIGWICIGFFGLCAFSIGKKTMLALKDK